MNATEMVQAKTGRKNPCTCLECVEKDEFGQPAKFYDVVVRTTNDGDRIAVTKDGSEHTRTYRAKHWICDACGTKFNWPPHPSGKLPARTQVVNGSTPVEKFVYYGCGMCPAYAAGGPRPMVDEDGGGQVAIKGTYAA